jgi:hypothetical protein
VTTIRDRIVSEALATARQTGPEPWATEAGLKLAPTDRPSWCGIWARAIWKRAGLSVPPWKIGSGNVSYLRKLAPGERAKPGDLATFVQFGHQCIVIEDRGETLRTIDGNSVGGVVAEVVRQRSKVAAFYSIEPLLGVAASKPAPVPPPPKPAPTPPEPAAGWLHGVDVSHHQDPNAVPWRDLAANGVRACWVRASYGTRIDGQAVAHVQQARVAGMRVGLYLFWRRAESDEAQLATLAERHMAALVGPGDLAPWIDVEHDTDRHGRIIDAMAASWRPRVDSMMRLTVERFGRAYLYAFESGLSLLGWPAWPLVVAHYRGDGEQRWPPLRLGAPASADVAGHQYGVGQGTSHRGVQMRVGAGVLDRDWMREPLLEIAAPAPVVVPPVVQPDARNLAALAADALIRGLRS